MGVLLQPKGELLSGSAGDDRHDMPGSFCLICVISDIMAEA